MMCTTRKMFLIAVALAGHMPLAVCYGGTPLKSSLPGLPHSLTPSPPAGSQDWLSHTHAGFEENKGQITAPDGTAMPDVLFRVTALNAAVYVTTSGLSYFLLQPVDQNAPDNSPIEEKRLIKSLRWNRIDVELRGAAINGRKALCQDATSTVYQYYSGSHPEGIPFRKYKKIIFPDIYPGIDWVLTNENGQGLEYDFIVKPGASPHQISMHYSGYEQLIKKSQENLEIRGKLGILCEGRLFCYQQDNKIKASYNLKDNLVTFSLGAFDPSQTLVIDPPLIWSTFYGGNGTGGSGEVGQAITTDANRNLYITGATNSNNFPLQSLAGAYNDGTSNGGSDAFVLKFDSMGVLKWATYFGGGANDMGVAIGADNAGNVFVSGETFSGDFPTADPPGAVDYFQGALAGGRDAFVFKLGSNGSCIWSTYYGGTGSDYAKALDIDSNGNVVVFAITQSGDIPTYNPGGGAFFEGGFQGAFDLFIMRFSNTGERQWATYYGGLLGDHAGAVTIDNQNNIYCTGITNSTAFPSQNPLGGTYYQLASGGSYDAYIIKFNSALVRQWATYYGGGAGGKFADRGLAITTDNARNVYLTGETDATDFPIQNLAGAYNQAATGGGIDAYIVKFNENGVRQWATYIGGSGDESALGITVANGDIFLAGNTNSPNFPTQNPGSCTYFQGTPGGATDAFILQFTAAGALAWGTYLGGTANDNGTAITNDVQGNLYVTGSTTSANFPTRNPLKGAYFQPASGGGSMDAIILKFGSIKPDADFSYTEACLGDTTPFIDESYFADYPYKWKWKFNDPANPTSDTSTARNPKYLYTNDGTYAVKLVVTDSNNCAADSVTLNVVVRDSARINAGGDQSVCPGASVDLSATISGTASSLTWQSSGSGTFSSTTSPAATYTPSAADIAAGSIKLTATSDDPAGSCPATKDEMIVTILPPDDASFSYSSGTYCNTGTDPMPTITGLAGGTFSGSSGLVISAADGTIDLSASTTGTHTVTYLTNGPCPASETFTVTITNAPNATFSYNGPYCSNLPTDPSPVFGPGASAGVFSANPAGLVFVSPGTGKIKLSASTPGIYDVTNTIAAAGGCPADVKTAQVEILPTPTSGFTVVSPACANEAVRVQFTGSAPAGSDFAWNFDSPSNATGSGSGPYDLYWDTSGTRTLSLIVTASGCVSAMATQQAVIKPKPTVTITETADTLFICPGETALVPLRFTGTGPWILGYRQNSLLKSETTSMSDYILSVSVEGKYKLQSVKDQFCYNEPADSIYLKFFDLPDLAATTAKNKFCPGDSTLITLNLTGDNSPFDVVIDYGRLKLSQISDGYSFYVTAERDTAFFFTRIESSLQSNCFRTLNIPVSITMLESPAASNIQFNCDPDGLQYQVSFAINGGDAASYTVNGTSTGSSYTSGWIPSGSAYDLTLTDINGCDPQVIKGVYRCNCVTEVGTASDNALRDLCADLPMVYPHRGDQVLDNNDTLQFILHDGTSAKLGNFLLRNNTGTFSFQPPLEYNKQYFITPIAGDHLQNGDADTTDRCLSIGMPIPVIFREVPGLQVTPLPNDSLCPGDTLTLVFTMSGDGPFDINYRSSPADTVIKSLSSGDELKLPIGATKDFEFYKVSGLYCTKNLQQQLRVHMPPPLDLQVNAVDVTCKGLNNGTARGNISGGYGGYQYEWYDRWGALLGSADSITNLAPENYILVITDLHGCKKNKVFNIMDVAPFNITSLSITNEKCYGDNTGQISIRTNGGLRFRIVTDAAPATEVRTWQPDSSFNLLHFNPGNNGWVVETENSKGCKADSSITIAGLDPMVLTKSPDALVCPGRLVTLSASATGGNGGFTYFWNSNAGSNTFSFTPSLPRTRTDIFALDSKGCQTSGDSIIIDLPPPLQLVQASSAQQLCYGDLLQLNALFTGGSGAYTYDWSSALTGNVGNGASYNTTATQTDTYSITATDTCGTSLTHVIPVTVTAPVTVDFAALPDSAGCVPLTVTFTNTSQGVFDQAQWSVDGMPADTSSTNYTQRFDQPGMYDVELVLTVVSGNCSYTATKQDYIRVYPYAEAAFEIEPEVLTDLSPTAFIRNQSQYATSYSWSLNGTAVGSLADPIIELDPESGSLQELCLISSNANNCNDTLCREIRIITEPTVYIPNTFTPDEDGHNERFSILYSGGELQSFHIRIFDRWGGQVFESHDAHIGWDGTQNGVPVQNGMYAYHLVIKMEGQPRIVKMGSLTIIR